MGASELFCFQWTTQISSKFRGQNNNSREKSIMRTFLAFACLLAVAVGAPSPSANHATHYQSSHHPSGGHTSTSYHEPHSSGHSAHKTCETHYKTIYKTVIDHKKIKKCEDVPKEVCNYIEKEICHQEEHHQSSHSSGGRYNNHYQHQPEVCHPESRKHCMTHHENVCHYETVDVPHKTPVKVPEQICHHEKHHSYGGHH